MAATVQVSLETVVVRSRPDSGEPTFEPVVETRVFQVDSIEVELQQAILAKQQEKVLLAVQPDGVLYQLARRKDVIKLPHDDDGNHLKILQMALKIEFDSSDQSPIIAAYPLRHDNDLVDNDLAKEDWRLILTTVVENSQPNKFRLYNVQKAAGGGVVPPCANPTIDCAHPRNPSELAFCKMNHCI